MSLQTIPATDPQLASTPVGVSNARRWTIVGLLFLASLINYFDRATISFALPLISTEFNLGPIEKGKLLSAFFWSYALMQIPLGWCADRLNLRWLYAGAFALWSVAQGLTGLATGLGMLIGFRLVLGIGEAIYLPGGSKIVSLLFSRSERGLPSGLFDFGTRTGLVVEGLLVPWMLEQSGWRATFVVVGFTALVWLVPWLWTMPARLARPAAVEPSGNGAGTWPEFLTVLGFSACLLGSLFFFLSSDKWQSRWLFVPLAAGWALVLIGFLGFAPLKNFGVAERGATATLRRLLAAARNKNLLGICLGFFCFDYYWYLLVTWLPDYLVNVRHLTIMKAGLFASLPFLVFGVSEPIGGWIADQLIRFGWDETRTRKGIVTVAFLTGLFLIPAARVDSSSAAIFLVVAGSLVGLSTGNLLVILQSCSPPEEIGLWTGLYNFVGNVAGILAPLVTGFLIKATGSYTPPFVLAAIAIAAGQLSFWIIVGPLTGHRDPNLSRPDNGK